MDIKLTTQDVWLSTLLFGAAGLVFLLPLAFASGESKLRTAHVTPHLVTNAEVIRAFGVAEIEIAQERGREGNVRVLPITPQTDFGCNRFG